MSGTVKRTERWRGLSAAALLAGALGLLTWTPALLPVAALAVALLAYGRVVAPPAATLALTRSVSDPDPEPGDTVTVQLTIENVGDRTLPELRLVDGVPPALRVVDGAPSLGTSLRPGGTATLSYAVEAASGVHEFQPATVLLRDAAGVVERRIEIEADEATEIGEPPRLDDGQRLPLRAANARYAGRQTVDGSGDGLTFRTIREYQRGDPLSRVDWRRRARTGQLATVEFHPERSLPVVLVVDTRPVAAVAPTPDGETAVERSLSVAEALFGGLAADDHRVGVATLGPERTWLAPGRGRAHEQRARELFSRSVEQVTSDGDGEGRDTAADPTDAGRGWLRERLPGTAEVIVSTPLVDDAVVGLIEGVAALGTPVSVVSPDPTVENTAGRTLARYERRDRLADVRASGVPVVDVGAGEDIERALATAGWSR
ncbi:Uncharacterized conserved protein, DUF58 family, contains vWF domain [Halorientalis persicus]|uniref:Uncharacterized conserved protein, DUF58 family, contains vWF domain n=1 Tax=Halorientalis persicus TaxID=1367881 RepID=A0A1H8GW68_9EURY|nr:DUF58 domain-containing protein [Halorientalis persicus]SEN48243.1 Uncharacterized conserved protein, DUF58 family, contains vWF domain [Halorientalis persicus]